MLPCDSGNGDPDGRHVAHGERRLGDERQGVHDAAVRVRGTQGQVRLLALHLHVRQGKKTRLQQSSAITGLTAYSCQGVQSEFGEMGSFFVRASGRQRKISFSAVFHSSSVLDSGVILSCLQKTALVWPL